MKFIANALAAAALLALGASANAQTLWYNGDADGVNALSNEINSNVTDGMVFDDFIVPAGDMWNITSVFSNNQMNFSTASARWEIRSGMSIGNGGSLLFGNNSAPATQTATGRNYFGLTEYTVEVPVNVTLGPGSYWLAVSPIGSGSGRSFISTTSKLNAVGQPAVANNNSLINSSFFGANYDPATSFTGPNQTEFSMGIRGTNGVSNVPEPGAVALMGGMVTLGGLAIRRRARK